MPTPPLLIPEWIELAVLSVYDGPWGGNLLHEATVLRTGGIALPDYAYHGVRRGHNRGVVSAEAVDLACHLAERETDFAGEVYGFYLMTNQIQDCSPGARRRRGSCR